MNDKKVKELLNSYVKGWDIVLPVFNDLRSNSESLSFELSGLECDCWAYCECHNRETCEADSKVCEYGNDHAYSLCVGDCGVECSCECQHSEYIYITSNTRLMGSEHGDWYEIMGTGIEYADITHLEVSCTRCRTGCPQCFWVNDLINKVEALTDDQLKAIRETAETLASDRGYYEAEAEDLLTALALEGVKINAPVNA